MGPPGAARSKVVLACLGTALAVAGCNVKVSPAAVDEAAQLLGKSARSVELADDDLRLLAGKYQVPSSTLADAAPSLQSSTAWQSLVSDVQRVNQGTQVPMRSVVIGTACDLVEHPQSQQDVEGSIMKQVAGLPLPKAKQFADDANETANLLRQSMRQGDSGKTATALLCFSVKRF